MRAGPGVGYKAQNLGYQEGGTFSHVHPDVNNFSLFGGGRFLIRNGGYQNLKLTSYDNTLRIDGQGQIGEGVTVNWNFNPPRAMTNAMRVLQSTSSMDYIVADGAPAYLPSFGLDTFNRHMIFLKTEGVLLVVDDIKTELPHRLSLDFHPEVQAIAASDGAGWISQDAKAVLRLQAFDSAATVEAAGQAIKDHLGNSFTLYDWKVERQNVSQWQSGVALTWTASGLPPIVKAIRNSTTNVWTFDINNGQQTVTLDVSNQTVSVR